MSDGHFNRALLPPDSFRSGLKTGAAQERNRCEAALRETLAQVINNAAEREDFLKLYHEKLKEK